MNSAVRVVGAFLAWMGALVGVLSAVSAVNRLFDIGLAGFFGECVAFYRQMMRPIYEFIERLLPFDISGTALDLIALYVIMFSMAFRASIIPLSDKEYFAEERMRDAQFWTIHHGQLSEPLEDNIVFASCNPDGSYTKRMYQLRPGWITIVRSLVSALSLWPVLSLAPARKLVLRDYVWRKDGKDEGEYLKFENAIVSKRHLRLTKMRLFVTAQILFVPFGMLLFYALAKFNPLVAQ